MRGGAAPGGGGKKKEDEEDARVRMALFGDENAADVDDLAAEDLTEDAVPGGVDGVKKLIYADFESSIDEQTHIHEPALIIAEEKNLAFEEELYGPDCHVEFVKMLMSAEDRKYRNSTVGVNDSTPPAGSVANHITGHISRTPKLRRDASAVSDAQTWPHTGSDIPR